MALTTAEREALIDQYASAPARLRAAVEAVPEAARKWSPADGGFSVHQVVVHCSDSETNAAARIRYLAAENDPRIPGYDPETWAQLFDYDSHPLEAALATVEAVRRNTTPLVKRLPASVWSKAGTHSESGRYTGEDWLRIYAAHVEEHIEQIERVAKEWAAANG